MEWYKRYFTSAERGSNRTKLKYSNKKDSFLYLKTKHKFKIIWIQINQGLENHFLTLIFDEMGKIDDDCKINSKISKYNKIIRLNRI